MGTIKVDQDRLEVLIKGVIDMCLLSRVKVLNVVYQQSCLLGREVEENGANAYSTRGPRNKQLQSSDSTLWFCTQR